MYRCCICESAFARPLARRWRERMPDGFSEPCCQAVCPVCGATDQYFDEISEGGDGDEPLSAGGTDL